MPTVVELIESLSQADKAEVISTLQSKAHSLWQEIFNQGHSTATAQAKKDKDKLESDLTEIRGQLATATGTIKELENKTPDIAAVRKTYEDKIASLESQIATRDQQEKERALSQQVDGVLTQLGKKLEALKINPRMVKLMLKDPDIVRRIKPDESGKMTIWQRDGNIPLVVGGNQDPLDLLSNELKEGLAPEDFVANVPRGSGVESGGAGGSANIFDKIRAAAEAEQKKKQEESSDTGFARLTGTGQLLPR